MAFREFYINNNGQPERAEHIHHVGEMADGTLEIAFTNPEDAPEFLEIAIGKRSLPNPGWEYSYRVQRVRQFVLNADDSRSNDPWTGKDRAWFVYKILEKTDFSN